MENSLHYLMNPKPPKKGSRWVMKESFQIWTCLKQQWTMQIRLEFEVNLLQPRGDVAWSMGQQYQTGGPYAEPKEWGIMIGCPDN